jgi:3-oxoacyl-(acyl-carrier-protein) synthase
MLGECFSASGAMQVAAALAALDKQAIPPTLNYQEKDPACDLNYVAGSACDAKVEKVLINNLDKSGRSSSLIISKFRG